MSVGSEGVLGILRGILRVVNCADVEDGGRLTGLLFIYMLESFGYTLLYIVIHCYTLACIVITTL